MAMIKPYESKYLKDCLSLMAQLGYPTKERALEKRLQNLLAKPDYHLWLFCQDEVVLGLIGFAELSFFEKDGTYLRILALVVDEPHRQKGIARQLLDEVKAWALANSCQALAVNSGITDDRQVAHRFYQNYGFSKKTYGFAMTIS